MADHQLTDPRVDATAKVTWQRVKYIDLATPVEQVIMHNLAEVMKEQQRLTERVEKLANAVERLANSQKYFTIPVFDMRSRAPANLAQAEQDSQIQ